MSSNNCFNLTVYRDSLYTQWGFRLEGGKDYQSPLTIQRVFQGSPASGYLQRGDIILFVQNKDVNNLSQHEVNEMIRKAGGSLQFTIKRSEAYPGNNDAAYRAQHVAPTPVSTPKNRNAPICYFQSSLNKVQYDHPNAKVYDPADPLSGLYRSRNIEKIRDPKPILSQTGSPMLPFSASPAVVPRNSGNLRRYQSSKTLPLSPINKPAPIHLQPYQEKEMIDKLQYSLQKIARPNYGPILSYPFPVANQNNNNGWNTNASGSNSYGGFQPPSKNENLAFGNDDNLKLVNNQYNTPIGLYSNKNINEEFKKQIGKNKPSQSGYELPASDF